MLLLGPLVSLLLLVGVSSGPAPQDGHAPLEAPQQAVNDPGLSRGKRDVLDDLISNVISMCYLRNDRYNEYLYVANWFRKDAFGRPVYTWVPGTKEGCSDMKFIKESTGKFYILSHYYDDEYLMKVNQQVRTNSEKGLESLWMVEIDSENKVRLSVGNGTYLGAYNTFTGGSERRNLGMASLADWVAERSPGHDKYPDVWQLYCRAF